MGVKNEMRTQCHADGQRNVLLDEELRVKEGLRQVGQSFDLDDHVIEGWLERCCDSVCYHYGNLDRRTRRCIDELRYFSHDAILYIFYKNHDTCTLHANIHRLVA